MQNMHNTYPQKHIHSYHWSSQAHVLLSANADNILATRWISFTMYIMDLVKCINVYFSLNNKTIEQASSKRNACQHPRTPNTTTHTYIYS